VIVRQAGVAGGSFFAGVVGADPFALDVELLPVEAADGPSSSALIDTYTKKEKAATASQVTGEVFFGTLDPQAGQADALLLTCFPHSLHFTSAIFSPFN